MQTTILNMADIKDINDAPGAQNTRQSYHFGGDTAGVNDKSLQLANILQSTLELNKLLELFDDELSSLVKHDGLNYVNREENHSITFGAESRHRCSYRLVLLEDDIGELTLYRHSKFDEEEIKILENTIAALIYPLRNAILYKQAVEKSYRDPLTGVNNRAALDNALDLEINLALRHKTPLSVIILDVDKFKRINDTYGHIAGDAVLKRIAESMVESARGSDVIYRYGGEEFVTLLRNTDEEGAKLLAERICLSIESIIFKYDNFDIRVTASAGLATLTPEDDLTSLLERCDKAMYQAKRQGRNQVVISKSDD
ncbi:MAG: diguanylate cyclase (GGDEF)-like protein [Gammaproteobacteria bacterium]|jgi:diguanylate cyclase (GGDEF)-like protein